MFFRGSLFLLQLVDNGDRIEDQLGGNIMYHPFCISPKRYRPQQLT